MIPRRLTSRLPRGGWAWLIKWGLILYFVQALFGVISGVIVGLHIQGVI